MRSGFFNFTVMRGFDRLRESELNNSARLILKERGIKDEEEHQYGI